MSILITGGAGFIGSNLAEKFLKDKKMTAEEFRTKILAPYDSEKFSKIAAKLKENNVVSLTQNSYFDTIADS